MKVMTTLNYEIFLTNYKNTSSHNLPHLHRHHLDHNPLLQLNRIITRIATHQRILLPRSSPPSPTTRLPTSVPSSTSATFTIINILLLYHPINPLAILPTTMISTLSTTQIITLRTTQIPTATQIPSFIPTIAMNIIILLVIRHTPRPNTTTTTDHTTTNHPTIVTIIRQLPTPHSIITPQLTLTHILSNPFFSMTITII